MMKLEQLKRANLLLFLIFFVIAIEMVTALCDRSPPNKNRKKNKVEKVHMSLSVKMDEKDNSKIAVAPRNAEEATLSTTTPPSATDENQLSFNNSRVSNNNSNFSLTDDDEELLKMTTEDLKIQEEWGGNCTAKHWDKCKCVRTWFGYYEDESDLNNDKERYYEIDCFVEPVICMKNGWTVSRCHLLCMGGCNKELQAKYDKYVSHEGECKAIAHG